MAKASTSAQHYVECEKCKKNPATFLCKTCDGRLCEPCKINHETKRITRESLPNIYKELEGCSKRQKEEIEKSLFLKYRDLLAKEREKRSAFTKRADEIQTKIDAHTQRVIERVKQIGQQSVSSLRDAEKDGLKEIDKFMDSIEKKTKQLEIMNQRISTNMEARPHSSMFRSNNSHDLKSFQTLPSPSDYTLTDFQPQQMNLENMFGKPSVLIIGCSQKNNSFVSYILKISALLYTCTSFTTTTVLPTFTTLI